jgi:hypothetical protein
MNKLNRVLLGLLMAAVLMAATAQPGAAFVLTLGLGNTAIAGYSGPFGTVEVTRLTGTTATIKFTSDVGPIGGYRYGFGGESSSAFNLADAANVNITFGALTKFNPAQSLVGPLSSDGSGNVSSWGIFNRRYKNFDGFGRAYSEVTYSLTKTSGSWATEDDILVANADGYRVAAHIFIANEDWTNANATGYATEGLSTVPEPMTLMTLGSGLVGLAGLQFRRRRNT